MKYRKKALGTLSRPLATFDALQFTGENQQDCMTFGEPKIWLKEGAGLILKSPNGDFIIEQNDWIIKLAENKDLHRCKGHLFSKIYESVPVEEVPVLELTESKAL